MTGVRSSFLAFLALFAALFGALVGGPDALAAEGGGKSKKISGAVSYVVTPTISSAVTQDYRFVGLIVVDAGLDIPDAKLRAKATANMPRVRAAMRAALNEFASVHYRPNTIPNADKLGAMLQASVDRTLGQGGAKVVYNSIMVQKNQ